MSDVDLSSTLLQALNDENKKTIRKCVQDKSVKKWIDNRVDPKQIQNAIFKPEDIYKDITCLCFASYWNDARTVQQLVLAGADVTATTSKGSTPLHCACCSETEARQKVEYLLGCDSSLIIPRNKENDTPLIVAAFCGTDTVISTLIRYGARVNQRGSDSKTALHRACEKGHVAFIRELMRHGADVDARDRDESTPLQLAAYNNQPACVKVLLDEYSPSINATDCAGCTALHWAAGFGYMDVVKLLTSHSECDVAAKNKDDNTATDMARREGHEDIVNHLISQPPVAIVTSSLAACNITDDKKVYGKYLLVNFLIFYGWQFSDNKLVV